MTTFGQWFNAQAGRGDAIGFAAKAWRDAAGDRPKASGIQSITRWMLADPERVPEVPADQLEPTMVAAASEYRTGAQQAASVPIPGQPVASVTPLPGMDHQQPSQPADGGPVFAQLTAVFTRLQAITHTLDEIKTALSSQGEAVVRLLLAQDAHQRSLAPLVALVAEVTSASDDSSLASQLGSLADGLDETAGQAAAALGSDMADLQQQPGQPVLPWSYPDAPVARDIREAMREHHAEGPAAFYGGHAVPEPDWAQLADAADPGQPDAG